MYLHLHSTLDFNATVSNRSFGHVILLQKGFDKNIPGFHPLLVFIRWCPPRPGSLSAPQISVKKCFDTLSILSLVTNSRAVELSPRLQDLAPAANHFFISGSTEEHTYSEQ